jgi:hypothetical protein
MNLTTPCRGKLDLPTALRGGDRPKETDPRIARVTSRVPHVVSAAER